MLVQKPECERGRGLRNERVDPQSDSPTKIRIVSLVTTKQLGNVEDTVWRLHEELFRGNKSFGGRWSEHMWGIFLAAPSVTEKIRWQIKTWSQRWYVFNNTIERYTGRQAALKSPHNGDAKISSEMRQESSKSKAARNLSTSPLRHLISIALSRQERRHRDYCYTVRQSWKLLKKTECHSGRCFWRQPVLYLWFKCALSHPSAATSSW